jgi:hypothetical protein
MSVARMSALALASSRTRPGRAFLAHFGRVSVAPESRTIPGPAGTNQLKNKVQATTVKEGAPLDFLTSL